MNKQEQKILVGFVLLLLVGFSSLLYFVYNIRMDTSNGLICPPQNITLQSPEPITITETVKKETAYFLVDYKELGNKKLSAFNMNGLMCFTNLTLNKENEVHEYCHTLTKQDYEHFCGDTSKYVMKEYGDER